MAAPYQTQDGKKLQILGNFSEKSKAILVFWPCVKSPATAPFYQIPADQIFSRSYGLVLYNPRGHSESEGIYHINRAAEDLIAYSQQFPDKPIIGIGHSAGASGLLRAASLGLKFKEIHCIAPIMDSRESLFYMYENNTINEFISLFMKPGNENTALKEMLASKDWLEEEYWTELELKSEFNFAHEGLNQIKFESVGKFLENIFHPGDQVYDDLKKNKKVSQIYLPASDNWFPIKKTQEAAKKSKVPLNIFKEATNHFFIEAWPLFWHKFMKNLI